MSVSLPDKLQWKVQSSRVQLERRASTDTTRSSARSMPMVYRILTVRHHKVCYTAVILVNICIIDVSTKYCVQPIACHSSHTLRVPYAIWRIGYSTLNIYHSLLRLSRRICVLVEINDVVLFVSKVVHVSMSHWVIIFHAVAVSTLSYNHEEMVSASC